MTNRERIIKTALCRDTDRPPFFFYFGPWGETVANWRTQGLEGEDWASRFGFDPGIAIVNVNLGYLPAFEWKMLEDKGDTYICTDSMGITLEAKKNSSTIPKYLDYPVKTREDWEELKSRLDPDSPRRFPPEWDTLVRSYNEGDCAVQLGSYPYGLFGTVRDIMGLEGMMFALYEQPELVRDIMDYLTGFWLSIYEKVCRDVKVDIIHIWEDMSGKQGSIISPAMVREFMLPNYRRIKSFADSHGIPIIALDTDGNCSELVPLFIEAGINLMMPFEVAAGSDIVEYRSLYPSLAIMGGIDKQKIALGRQSIDAELDRLDGMFRRGGYFAALDHLIHPDISWDDFNYFIERLKIKIGI